MNKILRILLIPVFLALCGLSPPCHAAVAEGSSPALVTVTLDDKGFDIAALRGKVVIVHFWATWCPNCREEMPVLDDFYLHHHTQGVEVIAVSVDRPRKRDSAIAYMHNFHFPASLISDAKINSFDMPGALPVTYILDVQGVVSRVFTPDKTALTQQSLDSAVLPLIAGSNIR